MSTTDPIGLYIHIPFCQSRCIYCDFFSTTALSQRESYVDALCREAELRSQTNGTFPTRIRTVYLGGGTPSMLEPSLLGQIFSTLFRCYDICPEAEITIEANPDDLTPDYVRALRSLPVNRLSLGIQTFSDDRLRFLHRRHTAQEAIDAVHRCQDAGYHNLSIDLMFGFPNETIENWNKDLKQATRLSVQHISAYALMYEEGTALGRMLQNKQISEVDEEVSRAMYNQLMETLQAHGYQHYELSNFSLPGFHSRHNSAYWADIPYIGLGAGAHSYDGNNRSWNINNINEYNAQIQNGIRPCETEFLTRTQKYDEYVMLRLRTRQGLDLQILKQRFGTKLYEYFMRLVRPHLNNGLLVRENQYIRLARAGLFVSDDIMSDLMYID